MPSSAVRKAFALFDTDGSGTLTAEECLAILTRGASEEEKEMMGMSVEDAQEIIDDFDTNGDGVLSIDEFAEAFDMFMGQVLGDSLRSQEPPARGRSGEVVLGGHWHVQVPRLEGKEQEYRRGHQAGCGDLVGGVKRRERGVWPL